MKQLEPILKYHFWILLVVGLIMALSGWWMSTSQMKAAIDVRKKAIDDAAKQKDVGEVPGKDWEGKLKAINAEQERLVNESRDLLYARQKERMSWPKVIREEAAKKKYRDEFPNIIHRINYRDDYFQEVLRVYSIPRPMQANDPNGVVQFPLAVMPHRVWRDHTPTSKQMWDSIEDLWLLEPILQAILEVNGGPEASPFDAVVLAIEHLKLYGGDRSKIGQSADASGAGAAGVGAASGFGGSAGAAGFRMADRDDEDGGGSPFRGGGGGGTNNLDFNPIDVFGDPGTDAPEGGDESFAGPSAVDGARYADNDSVGGGSRPPTGDDVGRRYIDDDPAQPYRTRGFKLTVIMDHQKVPDLYAQLTSNGRTPWPIQIVRMHVGRLSDSGGMSGGAGQMGAGQFGEGRFGGFGGANGSGFGAGAGARIPDGPLGAGAGPLGAGRLLRPRDDGDEDYYDDPTQRRESTAPNRMDNPLLARVTLAGLITLYREPEKKDEPAPANPSTETPVTGTSSDGNTSTEAAVSDDVTDPSLSNGEGEVMPSEEADGEPAATDDISEPAAEEETMQDSEADEDAASPEETVPPEDENAAPADESEDKKDENNTVPTDEPDGELKPK